MPPSIEVDGRDAVAVHFVARSAERVVGTLRLRPLGGPSAKVERVAVLRTMRGGGAGRALVAAAEVEAAGRGWTRLVLHAQQDVVGFYERLGWAVEGEAFVEADIPHRRMVRRVGARVRRAEEGDGDAARRLLYDVYVGEGWMSPGRAAEGLTAEAVAHRGRMLCVGVVGAPVGLAIYVPSGSPGIVRAAVGEAELHLLAVAAPWRRAGVGGALVEAVAEAAAADGALALSLWSQAGMMPAHDLYRRCGFAQMAPFTYGGHDFVAFRRSLAPTS